MTENKPVTPLYKAGEPHTVHTLVTELNQHVDNLDEIYVVIKDKNGNWDHLCVGDVAGIAFAMMLLNNYAAEHL